MRIIPKIKYLKKNSGTEHFNKNNQSIKMRFSIVLLFVLVLQNLSAQQNLPLIRANSKNVKIHDGLNYKADFWVIFPETKPDIYYIDLPRKKTLVKFITDIESISFNMNYGEAKDFILGLLVKKQH